MNEPTTSSDASTATQPSLWGSRAAWVPAPRLLSALARMLHSIQLLREAQAERDVARLRQMLRLDALTEERQPSPERSNERR